MTSDAALTDRTGMSIALPDRSESPLPEFLGPDDWQDLRSARLAALKDSPHAFVTSIASEERRSSHYWIDRLASSTWVVARDDDRKIVGLACSTEDSEEPDARYIESVWVEMGYRRKGVVRSMLKYLERDAHQRGADRLLLWVFDTNYSAQEAYVKLNFAPDGKEEKNRIGVIEQRMWKPI